MESARWKNASDGRPHGEPAQVAHIRGRVGHRRISLWAPPRMQLRKSCSGSGRKCRDAQTRQEAEEEQRARVCQEHEHPRARHLQRHAAQQRLTPTNAIGNVPHQKQTDDDTDRVSTERQRDGELGKAVSRLIEPVERCRDSREGHHEHEGPSDCDESSTSTQPIQERVATALGLEDDPTLTYSN